MECQFCETDKPLIKAHIIPKKFCQSIKIGKESPKFYSTTAKPKQYQNGIYDPKILCGSCDNLFGEWDAYAQNLFLKKIEKNKKGRSIKLFGVSYLYVNNIDYNKLKLFCMSLLFRASITSHELFKEVCLPDVKLKQLKKMLSIEDPGSIDEFSVVVIGYEGEEANWINSPYLRDEYNKPDEASFYEFKCGIYSFLIKADDKNYPDILEEHILRPITPLRIHFFNYKNTPEYSSIVESMPWFKKS